MSILFFLLWIVLNGRLTLELVLFGIAISTLVSVSLIEGELDK